MSPRRCWRSSRWFTKTPPTFTYVFSYERSRTSEREATCGVRCEGDKGGAITRWISGAMRVSMLCASKTGRTVLIADANEKQRGAEKEEPTRGFWRGPTPVQRRRRGSPPSNVLAAAPPDSTATREAVRLLKKVSLFHLTDLKISSLSRWGGNEDSTEDSTK